MIIFNLAELKMMSHKVMKPSSIEIKEKMTNGIPTYVFFLHFKKILIRWI